MQRASCPSCGAPVLFANKGSLATVCENCRTVVARKGTDLTAYGKVSEVRDDRSLLQIGTKGTWDGKDFEVIGRIQLQYMEGMWSEWHIAFPDDSFGWLAEAMGRFSVHMPAEVPAPDRPFGSYETGEQLAIGGRSYIVRNAGQAECIGGEGTLPFPVGSGYPLPFADLVAHDTACGTVDFSDNEPKLFLGRFVEFDDLQLKNLRDELPPDHPMARVGKADVERIACPSCNSPLERSTGALANTLHCQYCGSGIDLTLQPYAIFAEQTWHGLPGTVLKLGDVGQMEGVEFTCVAVLIREVTQWNVTWAEMLLFSPRRGYRWLLEQTGHFTWMEPMDEWPEEFPTTRARGKTFRLQESNAIRVKQVAGELYWRCRAGDVAMGTDYVNEPMLLSKEQTDQETNWTVGRYMKPKEVWAAFNLPGDPESPVGYVPQQPSRVKHIIRPMWWRYAAAMIALIALCIAFGGLRKTTTLASEKGTIQLPTKAQNTALSLGKTSPEIDALQDQNTKWIGPLEIKDAPTAIEVLAAAQVSNSWVYLRYGLYNADKGEVIDFGEEITYYHGPDWSEGQRNESTIVPLTEPGTYWLRVEGQGGDFKGQKTVAYTVTVKGNVILYMWAWFAFLLLTIPVIIVTLRHVLFNSAKAQSLA